MLILICLVSQELEQRSAELQEQEGSAEARQPEPAQEEMPDAVQPAAQPAVEEPQHVQAPAAAAAAQSQQPAEAATAQQEEAEAAAVQPPEGAAAVEEVACSRETPFKEAKPGDGGNDAAQSEEAEPDAAASRVIPDVRLRA